MEITLEKQDSTNATIKVNLKEADYQPKVQEKVKEYSKKAQIKGFRPGKVPPALIVKMYGKSILVDEINHLLGDSLNNYIKENNLPIIGDPLPDTEKAENIDWENQKEFNFNYNIGLVPEFNYDLSSNLRLNKYSIQVDDKVVQETLENLRSQFGKTTNHDTVETDDSVYGDLTLNDTTSQVSLDLKKATKAAAKLFIGKNKGDVVQFNIEQLYEDKAVLAHALGISLEEAKGKTGQADFKIINVNRSEKAAVDQDFFDKIFGKDKVKTEQEFMDKLKETIQENYQRETEFLIKRDIQNTLVNNTTIELPNDFLKRWLLVTNQGKVTQEQIDKEYDYYLKELKWNLIKSRIARDNDIKVENEEILSKSKEMIKQQFGGMDFGPEMEETLNNIANNYLQQDKGKNYQKIFEEVLSEKIASTVTSKITLEEKSISVDEFKALI